MHHPARFHRHDDRQHEQLLARQVTEANPAPNGTLHLNGCHGHTLSMPEVRLSNGSPPGAGGGTWWLPLKTPWRPPDAAAVVALARHARHTGVHPPSRTPKGQIARTWSDRSPRAAAGRHPVGGAQKSRGPGEWLGAGVAWARFGTAASGGTGVRVCAGVDPGSCVGAASGGTERMEMPWNRAAAPVRWARPPSPAAVLAG